MNKFKVPLQMHNKYHLTLIDATTGKVKQKETTTNILTNGFYYSFNTFAELYYCKIGTGTGEVQATDTKLFKELSTASLSKSAVLSQTNDQNLKVTMEFIFPATTSCVGIITEIGLQIYNNSNGGHPFVSHALLKDAEGNPISVNKTDTDKLIINVELNITLPEKSNAFSFGIFPDMPFSYGLLHDKYGLSTPSFQNWVHFCSTFCMGNSLVVGGPLPYKTVSADVTVDYTNRSKKYSNCRLGTEYGNNKYINYILFSGVGFVKFPNADIMPNRTIKGLSVGKGDGTTKQFKNPLPMFVKSTDKLYVDGVLQTRDVDYTIDNKANLDLQFEVTPGNFVKNIYGGRIGNPFNSLAPLIPFNRCAANADKFISHYSGRSYKYLSGDAPIIIELDDEAIDISVNGACISGMTLKGKNGTTNIPNLELVISYSTDNKNYTEACRVDAHTSGLVSNHTFETVKAKFWKLELDFTKVDASKKTDVADIVFSSSSINTTSEMLLYYKGNPITFNKAPAKDAVITMDCDIDRPYKTKNWIIDFNPEFQW